MQAVVMAAGISSRFYPFRSFSHKSLVSIMGKPVIVHALESLAKADIREVFIVVSPDSSIPALLDSGGQYGVKIKYIVQEKPSGAGDGLLLAEENIKGDFFLMNASRIDIDQFAKSMIAKKTREVKAVLLGKKQEKLGKYGVLRIEGDKVLDLIEKPEKGKEPSDLRLIGIYLFDRDFLKVLSETSVGHYSLEEAIASFAKKEDVRIALTDRGVPSLKYAWDLLDLKNSLFSNSKGLKISKSAKIAKSAEIMGDVVIDDSAQVLEGAKIKGPCYIGKKSMIGTNAIVRDGTSIEENCVIGANMEIKNSLVMKNTKVHSGFIGDSVIGESVRIGADFHIGNKRLDRKSVIVTSPEGLQVDTGLEALGVIIGNNVRIGIKSSAMPGIIIGENSVIGPSTTVLKNVPPDSKYYTKFQEVITKNK